MLARLNAYLDKRIPGARLQLTKPPQCPEVELYLLAPDYPQHELSAESAEQLMDNPPYWAFCWASGQVLAATILAKPQLVAGKTVVDFGSGSGVVAIAAAMAGAKRSIACDSDIDALEVAKLNANNNGVSIELCKNIKSLGRMEGSLITIADVFYDRENLPLLKDFNARFDQVLVTDSRLKGQALPGLTLCERVGSHTVPDLNESSDFNSVAIYRTQS